MAGGAWAVGGAQEDATLLARGEARKREEPEWVRLLRASRRDAVVLVGADGVVLDCSVGFTRLTGASHDSVRGRSLASFVHRRDQELVTIACATWTRGHHQRIRYHVRAGDGRWTTTRAIKAERPETRVVVYTAYADASLRAAAAEAGADGWVLKGAGLTELVAVLAALVGEDG